MTNLVKLGNFSMQKKHYKKNICRLCESKKLKLIYNLKPTPIGDDYSKSKKKKIKHFPLNLNICSNCNFIQLSHVVNANIVYGDYIYVTQTSLGLPKHFQNLINKLFKEKYLTKKSKVLEIGCNDGTLLNYINKRVSLAVGVDPAKNLKTQKLKIYKSMFNNNIVRKLLNIYGRFDCIVANNVIANVDELRELFDNVNLLLNENGYVVIETFSLYGLVKNNLIDNVYHEHLSYFGIKTLKNFLNRLNFKIVDAEHLEVKGGSLRLVLAKKINKCEPKKFEISKLQKLEENKLSTLFYNFKKIKSFNQKNKIKLLKFLKKLKNQKKNICGYGASVGTTTLLYYYDLKKFINNYFDDEKKRQYLFSPGSNIKVLPPEKCKSIKPDYIIIFAWRYAKEILKKNKSLLNSGTNFIVPLPKLTIINKWQKKYL
tara:strand:+ start:560 stop:1843 length:1284 start_codon:yes stop_codon:yes gene_type:complete